MARELKQKLSTVCFCVSQVNLCKPKSKLSQWDSKSKQQTVTECQQVSLLAYKIVRSVFGQQYKGCMHINNKNT